MVDRGSDDSMEQNGSFVRPYVSRSGQHGPEGEQFWSEDLDDAADRRSDALEDRGGDLLSNEWRRKADRERIGGEDGSVDDAQAALDSGDPHGEWGDREDSRDDWDSRRDATDEWEATDWDREDAPGDAPEAGMRRTHEDGGTEPSGFLGSGWRDGERPGEVPEGLRKSVLLRAGGVAAVVVGAIWALTVWVGQPSATPCPSGGCTAKPPAASSKVAVVPVDDPATTEEADPGDVLTPVTTATPTSTPHTTASPSATVTKAPVSHKPTTTATATAPPTSTPTAPKPTPTPKPTRTATPTPTPSGDDDDGGGGLFGWLF
ncbi:hypothetical protein [Planotetraspora mira]|uniref:Uncharacterized protein n=1 Tax=Planotetraspora mira TaxID=58121 RepID=A0A8J3TN18_9ACTN|nr:hypothetical protein [Planotetraspora mira]GII28816.1 hypothetical protein Pmi06nite_22580 [Planotetraspora mira]